ncbi:MAG: hypothetical protein JWM80_5410 [Cyanobacteria bacterium RYN_339]|nr:hypothetical protein [Cyanobacteria bacterium RYN_339]
MRNLPFRLAVILTLAAAGCQVAPVAPAPKQATPTPRASATPTSVPTDAGASARPSELPSAMPTPPRATAVPTPTPTPGLPFPTSPVTRFAVLTDFDAVQNFVPGEEIFGPLHLNRGPLGDLPELKTQDGTYAGRSRMRIRRSEIGPFPAVDGHTAPVFHGRVTLSYVPGVDPSPDAAGSLQTPDWFTAEGPNVPWAQIFLDPANATAFQGHAGPLLVDRPIPLPEPLAPRIAAAVGLPAGQGGLEDGVYVPTREMAGGYQDGATAAGGIYVRGTVQVLRGAVRGDVSTYLFQVGYPRDAFRVYLVRVARAARQIQLLALPSGEAFTGTDLEAPFKREAVSTPALAAWRVSGPGTLKMAFKGPFNGVIAVDRSKDDTGARPLTGHILALGDPAAETKLGLGGAADDLPPALRGADVFSTADPAGEPTGLTIWAAGSIFVQNHLIVAGLGQGATAEAYVASLGKPIGHDRLALWADGQVAVGLNAPGAPSHATTEVGTLLTASLIALGDPERARSLRLGLPFPRADEGRQAYLGSIGTEGLIQYYSADESYEVGVGPKGREAYAHAYSGPLLYPANPIYEELGQVDRLDFLKNPNGNLSRGRLVIFGSLIQARRGLFGKGDTSFTKQTLFDPRLGELPPPLVP